MASNVLIVEDDGTERDALARLVGQWGYEVETAACAEEALVIAEQRPPAVVITDLVLPEMDGVGLLQRLNETGGAPMVLVLTGHGSIDSAVEAMRRGAYDYLTKPVDPVRLHLLLDKAAERQSLSREVTLLRHRLRQKGAFGNLLGEAKSMQEVYRWIELAATSSAPVLIYGESGTGKELVARTIHERSSRQRHGLVAINCAAIPETLIESELFGHERGAFTGATERRAGCFELADGGTLFLDEIAEMDVSVQTKLLRVLQENAFRRVGGKTELKVDVRVIAATNQVPAEAIGRRKLREDLYYRLNVFPIPVPALRERLEDLPLLVRHFIDEFNREDQRAVRDITPEALRALNEYVWPGNIRQLRNIVQRAVIGAENGVIGIEHLTPELQDASAGPLDPGRAPSSGVTGAVKLPTMSLEAMERTLILQVVADTNFDRARAASILGLTQRTLAAKLVKHGIKS
jgi:DNA-binding NtrC family response regulator